MLRLGFSDDFQGNANKLVNAWEIQARLDRFASVINGGIDMGNMSPSAYFSIGNPGGTFIPLAFRSIATPIGGFRKTSFVSRRGAIFPVAGRLRSALVEWFMPAATPPSTVSIDAISNSGTRTLVSSATISALRALRKGSDHVPSTPLTGPYLTYWAKWTASGSGIAVNAGEQIVLGGGGFGVTDYIHLSFDIDIDHVSY